MFTWFRIKYGSEYKINSLLTRRTLLATTGGPNPILNTVPIQRTRGKYRPTSSAVINDSEVLKHIYVLMYNVSYKLLS